jgi:hypothetical protein
MRVIFRKLVVAARLLLARRKRSAFPLGEWLFQPGRRFGLLQFGFRLLLPLGGAQAGVQFVDALYRVLKIHLAGLIRAEQVRLESVERRPRLAGDSAGALHGHAVGFLQ